MIMCEAFLIGGVSQSIGIGIGLMLSAVLMFVINVQSFGWTIQFHLPTAFLFQSSLLILAVSALAGAYPAARATKAETPLYRREE
jgi:putative ABC transport system permease protein